MYVSPPQYEAVHKYFLKMEFTRKALAEMKTMLGMTDECTQINNDFKLFVDLVFFKNIHYLDLF